MEFNKKGREKLWKQYIKEIPEDSYYLTLSCILGSLYPGSEAMMPKLYDMLEVNWGTNPSARSGWTCCTGIGYHGDVMTIESMLLTVARLWSISQEMGLKTVTPSCVTSFGIHIECKDMYEHEPGLKEKADRWLKESCGREFTIPDYIIHVSDVVYKYREMLRDKYMRYQLIDRETGKPLKIVDHVGCHYSKLFPEKYATGGSEYCEVLSGLVKAWGGEEIDYPERRHCCGMGFRQCMITPNRGSTIASVNKKLVSMQPFEPDLIVTNCPGCEVFMDKGQWAVHELTGYNRFIPTLTYMELTGLLLGWDPYETVGIQFHTVPVEPLLDRIGIPYEGSKISSQSFIDIHMNEATSAR
jgi:heterodisulfide reductase subunit B